MEERSGRVGWNLVSAEHGKLVEGMAIVRDEGNGLLVGGGGAEPQGLGGVAHEVTMITGEITDVNQDAVDEAGLGLGRLISV